jgi:hypothetical protein
MAGISAGRLAGAMRGDSLAMPLEPALAPQASTHLTVRDRLGALRVRLGIRRHDHSVEPGLYRVGEPTPASPVLVTANYKLTFDAVRSQLPGVDAWLLVLDTRGINVWCAAGKGTFGTKELCSHVIAANLYDVVSHRTLVLPQLGAPGVAAHEVKAFTEFRVVYGPVRASDIPAFLEAGMKATPEMRTVTFTLRDRFVLTGTELSLAWRPKVLASMAAIVLASGFVGLAFSWDAVVQRGGTALLAGLGGLLAGALVTPLLLPWLPFRAFSAKGALVGAVLAAALFAFTQESIGVLAALGAATALVTVSSYVAMNFTGASNITSPSGVEYEMRRALPWQIAGAVVAVLLWLVSSIT